MTAKSAICKINESNILNMLHRCVVNVYLHIFINTAYSVAIGPDYFRTNTMTQVVQASSDAAQERDSMSRVIDLSRVSTTLK